MIAGAWDCEVGPQRYAALAGLSARKVTADWWQTKSVQGRRPTSEADLHAVCGESFDSANGVYKGTFVVQWKPQVRAVRVSSLCASLVCLVSSAHQC